MAAVAAMRGRVNNLRDQRSLGAATAYNKNRIIRISRTNAKRNWTSNLIWRNKFGRPTRTGRARVRAINIIILYRPKHGGE